MDAQAVPSPVRKARRISRDASPASFSSSRPPTPLSDDEVLEDRIAERRTPLCRVDRPSSAADAVPVVRPAAMVAAADVEHITSEFRRLQHINSASAPSTPSIAAVDSSGVSSGHDVSLPAAGEKSPLPLPPTPPGLDASTSRTSPRIPARSSSFGNLPEFAAQAGEARAKGGCPARARVFVLA